MDVVRRMRALLPLLLGLALACAKPTDKPAETAESRPSPAAPASSAAPVDSGVSHGTSGPETPREFPPVQEAGLVTLQDMRLMGDLDLREVRITEDGRWRSRGDVERAGQLRSAHLEALLRLARDAREAKPTETAGLPCDALPVHATRLTFAGQRSVGWSGPCAGPLPAEPVLILTKVLTQLGDGRSEAEIEQTLAQWPR